MGWDWTPVSLGGVALNDSTFKSYTRFSDNGLELATRLPVEVDIPGDFSFPEIAGSQLKSIEFPLVITTLNPNPSQTVFTTLRRAIDRYKEDIAYIVADDNSTQWQISCRVTRVIQRAQNYCVVMLYTNRSVFEAVNSASDLTNNVTVSGTTITLATAVEGTMRCYPTLGITPGTQKVTTADYRYRVPITVAWRSELPGTDSVGQGYPIDIVNDGFDTATLTTAKMQADGDDLRVIVDGVEYPRTLVDMDNATTEVWTPITFAPMKSVSMSVAASSSSPADAASWEVADGESLIGWPERGWFLIESEAVWYGARTDTEFQLIDRGARATTAAAHAAGTTAYWVEHDIQIIYGYSNAANPPTADFAISVNSSSNTSHVWSADFLCLDHADGKYGQMLARFTEDNARSASLSAVDFGVTNLRFYDIEPGGAFYPFNNAEIYVPCGVEASAGALAFTVGDVNGTYGGDDIVLDARVFGVDVATGVERLLATYNKAGRTGAVTITPDAVLSRVRFNALYVCITGAVTVLETLDRDTNNDGRGGTQGFAQGLTLTQPCTLVDLAALIKENTSGDTRDLDVDFSLAGSTDPSGDDELWNRQVANANFTTSYTWVRIWQANGTPFVVPAGEYNIQFFGDTAGAGTIYVKAGRAAYAGGKAWEKNTTWASSIDSDINFLLIGDGSHLEDTTPAALSGAVSFDAITVTLDDTTPRTPVCVIGAEENIFVLRGTLAHNSTGQTITFNDYVMKIADTLTIDCKAKTVALNASINRYEPGAVSFSDGEQWMHFQATGNTADNRLVVTDATIDGGGAVNIAALWYPVFG